MNKFYNVDIFTLQGIIKVKDISQLNLNSYETLLQCKTRMGGVLGSDYNVLNHTMFMYEELRAKRSPPEVLLMALLHDIEEIVTGDLEAPVKTILPKETIEELNNLRTFIIEDICGNVLANRILKHEKLIKKYDNVAFWYEMDYYAQHTPSELYPMLIQLKHWTLEERYGRHIDNLIFSQWQTRYDIRMLGEWKTAVETLLKNLIPMEEF